MTRIVEPTGLLPYAPHAPLHVARKDGEGVRFRTRAHGGSVTARPDLSLHSEQGPFEPCPYDPRHEKPFLVAPGLFAIMDIQGGESGEMYGTLTLTRGERSLTMQFQDDPTDDTTSVFYGLQVITHDIRDLQAIEAAFTRLTTPSPA